MITLKDTSTHLDSKSGSENFELLPGETLKIETSPGGEEKLSCTPPAGKRWRVGVSVNVSEEDI